MIWHDGKKAGAHRRIVITMAFLAALMPTTALAQGCGKLQLLNTVQLIPSLSGALDLVPVAFQDNQKTKFLLLDTGGLRSQLTMDAAEDLASSDVRCGLPSVRSQRDPQIKPTCQS